jgi:tetratricopeptide (TPR) repeat protein
MKPTAAAVAIVLFMVMALAPLSNGAMQIPTAQTHAAKGRELLARGYSSAAERELRQAVELAPHEAEYLALLGVALGMQRKLQESDVYLEKALQLDPADSVTRRNLAWNQGFPGHRHAGLARGRCAHGFGGRYSMGFKLVTRDGDRFRYGVDSFLNRRGGRVSPDRHGPLPYNRLRELEHLPALP